MEGFLKTFDLVPFDLPMIALGAILFVGLYFILSRAIFTPLLRLLEAREAATNGTLAAAASSLKTLENLEKQFNEKVHTARMDAFNVKLSKLHKVKEESLVVVSKAESEAMHIVEKGREEISKDILAERSKALSEVDTLASMVIQKVGTDNGQVPIQ